MSRRGLSLLDNLFSDDLFTAVAFAAILSYTLCQYSQTGLILFKVSSNATMKK